jgi:hypothetical protein
MTTSFKNAVRKTIISRIEESMGKLEEGKDDSLKSYSLSSTSSEKDHHS